MTTALDVTNRALAQIGTRSQITSMTDGSTEALYANLIYAPLRDFLLREGDYDFAMKAAAAAAAGTVIAPWTFSYSYPADALRIRQLIATAYNPFKPLPVEWNIINIANIRYLATRAAINSILYTFAAVEDDWDAIFTEAFTRLLASALAFALENRIEASKEKLSEALSFAGIANMRDS